MAEDAVNVAARVLFLRATTQIDELMKISSSAMVQRWDFLGPPPPPPIDDNGPFLVPDFFSSVDAALQWHEHPIDIGQHIQHAHFAPELTEEQAEIVCPANVRFVANGKEIHSLVPFMSASTSDHQAFALAIDLIKEDGEWRYMDAVACPGTVTDFQPPTTVGNKLFLSYNEALASISSEQNSNDDDDDDNDNNYWGNYSEGEGEEEEEKGGEEVVQKVNNALVLISANHSLLGAAAAMKALGATEAQFLALASKAFNDI
ncbi:hypothetical protein GGI21_001164 [Coemansia aciculifera]|nr:hypothetical protein GGI21_001164 [Coemansia aciculifera]